jgi:hypothetical protein
VVDNACRKGEIAMKFDVSTVVLSAGAASKRPISTAAPNRVQLRCVKRPRLLLLLALVAPLRSFAAEPYRGAVSGGFGNGGTTFVERSFSQRAEGKCTLWSGYTKTASTVILT